MNMIFEKLERIRRPNWLECVNTILLLGALVATGFAARYSFDQAEASRKQANAAQAQIDHTREIAITAQRAWLAPGGIRITESFKNDKFHEVFLDYTNTGNSPALAVNQVIRALAIPAQQIHKTEIVQAEILKAMDGAKCKDMNSSERGFVIYPTSAGRASAVRVAINKELVNQIIGKENYLVIAGCFAYVTFEETHHSGFCRFFDFGVLKSNPTSLDWSSSKCFIPEYAD